MQVKSSAVSLLALIIFIPNTTLPNKILLKQYEMPFILA